MDASMGTVHSGTSKSMTILHFFKNNLGKLDIFWLYQGQFEKEKNPKNEPHRLV
jgi:hypothetical protein